MNVTVNNEVVVFEGHTLGELIEQLDLGDEGYAVAVGKHVVPRQNFHLYKIIENDSITIIGATHGG